MIEGLKPYPDYQLVDSRWIPRAPSHWEVKKLRALTTPRSERNRPDLPLLSVARERGVFIRTEEDDNHNFVPDDLSNYKVAHAGSLVINKMKAWQGSMGISPTNGIVSPAYFVYDLRISNRMFGQALLRSRSYVAHFAQASDGVRVGQWDLSINRMREIPVVLPPPEEQAAIVRFLDHANRRIDQFIRAKKKFIALLNEQKQAIIHRAVTRGLDPNVKLKNSGVPWLGQAPAHWHVTRLKFEASHIIDCLHATPPYRSDGIFPAIRTADIEPGRVRLQQARRLSETDFIRWTQRLEPTAGDILYSREGERFGLAAPVPAGVRLCISQRMMVFRIRSAQDAAYIMWQLNCPHVYQQASEHTIGSTSPHVNVEQIRNFLLVLPPHNEQARIATYIDTKLGAIVPVLSRAEKEIELAREYRTRLIADVVTGQLDVRAAAASLPDFRAHAAPAEPESDDEDADLDDSEAV